MIDSRVGRRAASVGLLLFVLGAAVGCQRSERPAVSAGRAANDTHEAFLAQHWARPLAPQFGSATASDARLASLDPARCGACHSSQYADWRTSLHGRAMGPGVFGQLMPGANAADDPGQCTRCHAPLAEQSQTLARSAARGSMAEGELHSHGLTCAGCHMRAGRVWGPPRRDGSGPRTDLAGWPHDGWTAAPAFEDSRFCAACHQFDSQGYALNGKPLENTYEEWRASPQGAQGRPCQSCHMPDRRHLWRGIHDPEMVRQALTVEATEPVTRDGELIVDVVLRNTGAGHHFPTYVTPKVFVEGYQEDRKGRVMPGTMRSYEISRAVSPSLDRELADTRIPAGGQRVFAYRAPRSADASAFAIRVRVDPDAFYRGVYESLLDSHAAGTGEARIRQALANAETSAFIAYASRVRLSPSALPASNRRQITESSDSWPAPRDSRTKSIAAHCKWVGQACG